MLDENRQTFIAGVFYLFLIMTSVAFLLHLFGLTWLENTITIEDPSIFIQELVKAILKSLELTFIYKLLSKKGFFLCICISILHVLAVGFLPANYAQPVADAVLMFSIPFVLRKDKRNCTIDFIFVYTLMTLYGLLLTVAKFGDFGDEFIHSFYANLVGIVDYKLFVVTLYLYVNYKGGIRLWKTMKRKLLS